MSSGVSTHMRCILFAAIGFFLAVPRGAWCDDAKGMHAKGVELFEAGQYLEAARAFREANALRPTWKLQFNIGQSEAAAKRYGRALEAFEAYMVGGGDDVPLERREYVAGEVRRIQPLVGQLEVNVDDALVLLIDGDERAVTPLDGPLRVAAGRHEVVLQRDGEVLLRKSINIGGGMRVDLKMPAVDDAVGPSGETADEGADESASKGKSGLRAAGWSLLGVGAAAGIAGIVTGVFALQKDDELAAACPDKTSCPTTYKQLRDQSDSLALSTNVLIPAGAVAAATGIVLVLLSRRGTKTDEGAARGMPSWGLNGKVVTVEWRF